MGSCQPLSGQHTQKNCCPSSPKPIKIEKINKSKMLKIASVLVFGLLGSCMGDTHEYVPYANYYDTYTPGSTVTGGTVIYPRTNEPLSYIFNEPSTWIGLANAGYTTIVGLAVNQRRIEVCDKVNEILNVPSLTVSTA